MRAVPKQETIPDIHDGGRGGGGCSRHGEMLVGRNVVSVSDANLFDRDGIPLGLLPPRSGGFRF